MRDYITSKQRLSDTRKIKKLCEIAGNLLISILIFYLLMIVIN